MDLNPNRLDDPEQHPVMRWPIIAALITSVIFLGVLWFEETTINKQERLQLVELTDSFVAAFSQTRVDDAIIPSEFRRIAMDNFTAAGQSGLSKRSGTVIRMPGTPGLELGQSEPDDRLAAIISDYAADPVFMALHEQRIENGRIIARTLVPTVADNETCVTCHNALLNQEIYEVGDIMGAYIIERDMTNNLITDLKFTAVFFFASLLLFHSIGYRERLRNLHVIQLTSRVRIEEMKNAADVSERFLLSHDALTGLPNRKLFNEHLSQIQPSNTLTALNAALIDLDDFKMVNDTMGHAAGDALLIEVAHRLKAATQTVDAMVARLGGDEFAIVWQSDAQSPSVDRIAADILNLVVRPMEFETWVITPKCSIGVASANNDALLSPTELIKSADAALYVAKDKGKNTYQLFDFAIDASVRRKIQIASVLPQSIQDGDIRIVFQPKVALQDGSFEGFEALARWSLDDKAISPIEFVKVAENAGVVKELDLHVLDAATLHAKQLEVASGREVPISVNLSAKTCQTPELIEEIQDILWTNNFAAKCLTVEVTETSVVENLEVVQDLLLALRKIGVRTAIDDFGTGYSSLAYLTKMAFDEVKIDRAFVRDLALGNENHIILTYLGGMLGELEIDMVVEGIETEKQLNLLKRHGNFVGQGYYFSVPLEIEDAEKYLLAAQNNQSAVNDA